MSVLSSLSCFSADWPVAENIKTCITTRQGGFSGASWSSFNLAYHVLDKKENVNQNRDLLYKLLPKSPTWLNQQHSATCIELPVTKHVSPLADGAITGQINQPCAVLTADCLPLLICSKNAQVVAAIHAGWKGLASGIIEHCFEKLFRLYQIENKQFMIWLGPAISQQAFEVGSEVRDAFISKNQLMTKAFQVVPGKHDKYMADIYLLARIILNRLNIDEIYGGDYCTFTDQKRFYSYRRDGTTGRMASIIWIEN